MEININKLNLNNINIIDIRDKIEYNTNHILNSINIIYDDLMFEPEKYLDKNKEYYFYCTYGIKSLKLSKYLNRIGYKTFSIEGGFNKFIK